MYPCALACPPRSCTMTEPQWETLQTEWGKLFELKLPTIRVLAVEERPLESSKVSPRSSAPSDGTILSLEQTVQSARAAVSPKPVSARASPRSRTSPPGKGWPVETVDPDPPVATNHWGDLPSQKSEIDDDLNSIASLFRSDSSSTEPYKSMNPPPVLDLKRIAKTNSATEFPLRQTSPDDAELRTESGRSEELESARQSLKSVPVVRPPEDLRSPPERAKLLVARKNLMSGQYFVKLQEGKAGKVSHVIVGVAETAGTFWWDHGGNVSTIPLSRLQRVEYGIGSGSYRNLREKFPKHDQRNVLPWNCVTLVFKDRKIDLYADRKRCGQLKTDAKSGRKMLVVNQAKFSKQETLLDDSPTRFAEVDDEMEKFILAFSRFILDKCRCVPGLAHSVNHLRWKRAIAKAAFAPAPSITSVTKSS